MNYRPAPFFCLAILLASTGPLWSSENWPGWRGPRGDGTVLEAPSLPIGFSVTEDTVWKTEIPGIGHASPIIWQDRIFLVTADAETTARSLLCLDRASGKVLWTRVVLEAPFEDIHRLNSHCLLYTSPSPRD